jgi:hypothetical protein
MRTAVLFVQNAFHKTLEKGREHNKKWDAVYMAFTTLASAIEVRDETDQINLYSVATQLLESLLQEKTDPVNSLDVFCIRCDSILHGKHPDLIKASLILAVIVIAIASVLTVASLSLGFGILMGFWVTPMAFLSACLAAETTALITVATSLTLGVGAGMLSGILFFKQSPAEKSVHDLVDAVKESCLIDSSLKFDDNAPKDEQNNIN